MLSSVATYLGNMRKIPLPPAKSPQEMAAGLTLEESAALHPSGYLLPADGELEATRAIATVRDISDHPLYHPPTT